MNLKKLIGLGLFVTPLLVTQKAFPENNRFREKAGCFNNVFSTLEISTAPTVIKWITDQNQKSERYLAHIPFRSKLKKRLAQLTATEKISTPASTERGLFYKKQRIEKNEPQIFFQNKNLKQEQLVLDPNQIDGTLETWIPSPNGEYLAYSIHLHNSARGILKVRQVATGLDTDDSIPWLDTADLAWKADSSGFYYTHFPLDEKDSNDDLVAHAVISFHALKTDPHNDTVVFPETNNPEYYLTPSVSSNGRWIFITVTHGWTSNTIYYRATEETQFHPLFVSSTSMAHLISIGDTAYLLTNQNAPFYKVDRIELIHPTTAEAKPVPFLPERPGASIVEGVGVKDALVFNVIENLSTHLEIFDLQGHLIKKWAQKTSGTIDKLVADFNQNNIYFSYESFVTPPTIYALNISSPVASLWNQQKFPFDFSSLTMDKQTFSSQDGTSISMFVVQQKNPLNKKPKPFLLEGYGGFNVSCLSRFNPEILVLLENGFGYALPHLRGGGEYGETWHQAGMKTNKPHTFQDFFAAAEFLIKQKYTTSNLLAIKGNSNGGLLVNVALTQRPDLFRAAISEVPLADMIRYPLFGEGRAWISEYGSPENPEERDVLCSYSPVHHAERASYPSVLLIASDHDDRVDPMHARKMAAALQAANLSTHPILLKTRTNAGHSGSGIRSEKLEGWVDKISFLLNELKND